MNLYRVERQVPPVFSPGPPSGVYVSAQSPAEAQEKALSKMAEMKKGEHDFQVESVEVIATGSPCKGFELFVS